MISSVISFSSSNDSFEGEPEEKRRKTTNVVIDQPATEHKVLIDNVPDNSGLLDEVRNQKHANYPFNPNSNFTATVYLP